MNNNKTNNIKANINQELLNKSINQYYQKEISNIESDKILKYINHEIENYNLEV